ncbi:MAG: saccharopine dehydrogenase NADP-binding domain-containing protein [Bacteroidia bacterium]|nr:saccharopine dehydrogenase NADP-binding domain-containing protein [Bacteroidia bacterium]
MAHFLILGAGRVGRAIALDLAQRHIVTAADRNPAALQALQAESASIEVITADLVSLDPLHEIILKSDIIITALPGRVAYKILQELVSMGKRIVDISFFPQDPYDLSELTVRSGSILVVDAGVAPGLSNLLLGYESSHVAVDRFVCYVGGLPLKPSWPFQYKAPFSPEDVIEEYTRPVRQRIGGSMVIKPPLSDLELVSIPDIGLLEAFNTDGLRTLLRNTSVPTLIEKTLRYPGHAEYIQLLLQAGFLSDEPIETQEGLIRPRQVTAALLYKAWAMSPTDEDMTIMDVHIHTVQSETIRYTLIDTADVPRQISSMARTTGYTCTALATWLLDKAELPPGVYAPEQLAGIPGCFEYVRSYLSDRNVVLHRSPVD